MESIAFDLKLMDSVSAPARRAADAMAKLEARAKKAQEALDARQMGSFGKQFEKVGFAAERAAIKHQNAFAGAWAKIGLAAQKAQERAHKQAEQLAERQAEKAKEHSLLGGIKEGLGFGKFASAAFVGSAMAEGAMKLIEGFVEGAHKAVELLAEGIAKAFEESGRQETLRLGEKLSLGKGAGEYREDVGRFSKLTGFDDDKIRALLLPARRAGFNQQGARTAFAAAADVAAGEGQGGNFGRVQELMQAFEHIKLKGGVQERLLPNLGVDVKGFYADLAKSLKVGVQTAKKMAEEGKVDPQLLLNTIFRGIEKKQGGQLGTGAIEYSKTFEARFSKLKNLPNEFFKGFSDTPEFKNASDAIGVLLENLDPESPRGQRIMASLQRMFAKITGFIGDPAHAADSIANGIDRAVYFAEQLIPSLKTIGEMFFNLVDSAMSFAENIQLANAYIMRDKTTIDEIHKAQEDRKRERFNRVIAGEVEKREDSRISGDFGRNLATSVNPMAATVGMMADRGRSRRLLMQVTNNINVSGTDRENAEKAAAAMQQEMGKAAERYAQEGG